MEQYVLKAYLTLEGYKTPHGMIMESCLTAALREARIITGRNSKTGLVDPENKCGYKGNWMGAMGYITFLDQIGKSLKPTYCERIENKKSDIIKALTYFTNLPKEEIEALYALRNAFFHDFSLYNSNPKNLHFFQVHVSDTGNVVNLPSEKWDGDIDNLKATNQTVINLKTLGDLVEDIYKLLLKLEESNELKIELKGGEKELLRLYTFLHP
jgi:hypothetical protein